MTARVAGQESAAGIAAHARALVAPVGGHPGRRFGICTAIVCADLPCRAVLAGSYVAARLSGVRCTCGSGAGSGGNAARTRNSTTPRSARPGDATCAGPPTSGARDAADSHLAAASARNAAGDERPAAGAFPAATGCQQASAARPAATHAHDATRARRSRSSGCITPVGLFDTEVDVTARRKQQKGRDEGQRGKELLHDLASTK